MIVLASQVVVVALGVTILVMAAWGMFAPDKLMALVTSTMDRHWGIYFAVMVRLVMGAALIIAAPESRFPVVFEVLGWIAIVAAVALVLMGRERVRRFMAWCAAKFSAAMIRLWLVFGIAFGGLLVYGALPVAP